MPVARRSTSHAEPVAVIIDGPSLFHDAMRTFGFPLNPALLACDLVGERPLQQVVYCSGVPDARRQPQSHRRALNQHDALRRLGVDVRTVDLTYATSRDSAGRGRPLGIDVLLSIAALQVAYEQTRVGVVFVSSRRALRPIGVELARLGRKAEVAATSIQPSQPPGWGWPAARRLDGALARRTRDVLTYASAVPEAELEPLQRRIDACLVRSAPTLPSSGSRTPPPGQR